METIAIVFGVIWLVSGWYISYTVNHYYDKLWYSPFDIVRYWKMCRIRIICATIIAISAVSSCDSMREFGIKLLQKYSKAGCNRKARLLRGV